MEKLNSDYDYIYKIVFIGDASVGKTSLLDRFSNDFFNSSTAYSTVGVDFRLKNVAMHGKKYKLQLWDTAGQERYLSLVKSYIRGADGIVIVYDTTSLVSLKNLAYWMLDINGEFSSKQLPVIYIAGNKSDLKTSNEIFEDIKELPHPHIFVSAKTGENVDKLLSEMTNEFHIRLLGKNNIVDAEETTKALIKLSGVNKKNFTSCCSS